MHSSVRFSDRALRLLAEAKLQAAIEQGDFAELPGLGKPCPVIDEPYDAGWWIRRKLKREQLPFRLGPNA
ncbi:MAG: DUF1992 domain-containing protein [Planctomycetales bacterium]|nr:DUF1992 domain-containing protein [Planctomycetales bacterium]